MNKLQYLLCKLAEEASEISQIAMKTQQFGPYEICPDLPESNIERVNKEFNDLLGVVEMINEYLDANHLQKDEFLIEEKKKKVEKYFQYSVACGQIKE